MKNFLCLFILLITIAVVQSDAQSYMPTNQIGNLSFGGYAQIDYNQPLHSDYFKTGKLDVHRLVTTFNYAFNSKTNFYTEIEYEHVKEVYIEQAFLRHRLNDYINLKAGLMLVPMGIINEFHEPPLYNGVERPNLDKVIVPTTWREIGIGFSGRINEASLKYQAYLMNGFKSFNGDGLLRGKDGLRKGRQKGAESIISSPNLSTKVEYYGIPNLKIGLSGYFGKTQSTAYEGLLREDQSAMSLADSTVVGIAMGGVDLRYQVKAWQMRGQLIIANLSNTEAYNSLTDSDLGAGLFGYYAEVGYNVLQGMTSSYALIPFIRFEHYDTHYKVSSETMRNEAYSKYEVTFGLTWKLTRQACLKADYQWIKAKGSDESDSIFNAGVGIMF